MLKIITPPTAQPLSLDQVKAHLRVTDDNEDLFLDELINAACNFCEAETGRALMPQEWSLTESVNCRLVLRKLPVTSIISIKHIDEQGNEQIIDPARYRLINHSDSAPAWVAFLDAAALPSSGYANVFFRCGYADADAVPPALKRWMLLHIGHWYMNRESVNISSNITSTLPFVDSLLDAYRAWNI